MAKKIVIAVIDDDELIRTALTSLMKSIGYRTVAFESAEQFLNSGRYENIDCIIADIQMPNITGPELHRRLVASGKSIPTILITAYFDEVMKAHLLRTGIKCYLAKPFNENELMACISAALGDNGPPKPTV